MIELYEYDPAFDEAIAALDLNMYHEIKEHEDVMHDTIRVAVKDEEEFVGCGFLLAGPSLRELDRHLPYYHVHMEFLTWGSEDDEEGEDTEVEASMILLEALTEEFNKLQKQYPEHRLVLRTWASGEDTAYLDYLANYGFSSSRVMVTMERYLVDDHTEEALTGLPEDVNELRIELLDPEDAFTLEEYQEINECCFGVGDSPAELLYRMKVCGARVFLLYKGREMVSSMTVWNTEAPFETAMEGATVATENIFTTPECQRLGYGEYLMGQVLTQLAREGASKVILNVYGDDLPAQMLYQKMEYETTGLKLEMHYETDPRPMPY